jgi:hypothetical protein
MGPAESVFDALITTDQSLRYQQTSLAADVRFFRPRDHQLAEGPESVCCLKSRARSPLPQLAPRRQRCARPRGVAAPGRRHRQRRLGVFPKRRRKPASSFAGLKVRLLFFMRARQSARRFEKRFEQSGQARCHSLGERQIDTAGG